MDSAGTPPSRSQERRKVQGSRSRRNTPERNSRRTRSPTPRRYKDGYRSIRDSRSRSRRRDVRYRHHTQSPIVEWSRKRHGNVSYSSDSGQSYDSRYTRRERKRPRIHKRKYRYTSSTSSTSSRSQDRNYNKQRKAAGRARRGQLENTRSSAAVSPTESSLLEKLVNALSERGNSGSPGTGLHASQNIIADFDPQAKSQTMKDWISKINESAHVYGWSERQTIFYALPKLKGLAKRWYDGLTSVKYSWLEWQSKLLNAFPCEQNYGDLLSEMLSRKTRRNETLEEYYYDKVMLINRCELKGKQAVDCLTHGIFDANIKMNVQGANFQSPESVLKYFRNISSKTSENIFKRYSPNIRDAGQPNLSNKLSEGSNIRRPYSILACYNCGESGHTVQRCTKQILKCAKCRRFGHLDKDCTGLVKSVAITTAPATGSQPKLSTTRNVLSIQASISSGNDKYYKSIIVNGKSMTSFIDLGSQCTLLRADVAPQLELTVDQSDLPNLKGFGCGSVVPLGRVKIQVTLDAIKETVDAYLVEPNILPADVLIGQSLTELPGVRAYKTEHLIVFYKDITQETNKLVITNSGSVIVQGYTALPVNVPFNFSGVIYLDPEVRLKTGEEYLILPGVYSVKDGVGSIIVIGLSSKPFLLRQGTTLARVIPLSTEPLSSPPYQPKPHFSVNSITEGIKTQDITTDQLNVDEDLDTRTRGRLCALLNSARDCFAFSLDELGKTSLTEMQIELKDNTPVTYRPYRLSFSEREKVNKIVNNLLANGIIRESRSEYASPIILVTKKNGEPRLCVDYRALNRKTVKDKFPMPLIDDQIDSLSEQVYFTTLDLTSGYHQVPVSEESKHITAFITPDGHYEYNRMPFGLTNAPAVFQRLVLSLLKQQPIPGVLAYMDDIIISSKTIDEGLEKLKALLDLLREANLTLNLGKCSFFKRSIEYLGFEISEDGVRPGQRKTEAVTYFKTPQNVHEVRQFVGLSSFFRRFVPGYASIARPLTCLTKNNVTWAWGQEQDKAFSKLKETLTSRPVLAIYNHNYETELHTDASSIGLGGILLQRPNKESPFRAVAYFSRQTTAEEQHYHSFELETLAVVTSLQRFRIYLLGLDFKIVTDCNALRTTLTKRDLIPRIARWWLLVQEFTFSIEYRPGAQLAHADALSRNPVCVANEESNSILQLSEVHWLQAVQMGDPRLCHIKAVLDNKCQEAKDIQNNYEMKDGKIYRKVNGELKWAVPKDSRWKILQQCHDQAGHFSYDKTLEKVKRDYWFPRLNQFVKKYVRACIPCAHAKQPGGKKQGLLHPIPKPSSPFQCFHIDHLGPFVKSKRGNMYILGIIDSFTKFIILKAVKNTKSKTSINVLRDVCALFGTPKILISDRGTSFTSLEFKTFMESIGVKHTLNAVATPRANGQIERYNRSVLSSLTALCHGEDDREWDTKLNEVQWSMNNTVNQSTKKSPAEIIFGKPTVSVSEGHLHDVAETTEISQEAVEKIREEVSENIISQQEKMKTRYNTKRRKPNTYKVGDLVMVQKSSKTPGESNKLVPAFSGPYRVTAVFEHDRYEVSSVEGFSKKKYKNVFSVDKMKPWVRFEESESDSNYGDSD